MFPLICGWHFISSFNYISFPWSFQILLLYNCSFTEEVSYPFHGETVDWLAFLGKPSPSGLIQRSWACCLVDWLSAAVVMYLGLSGSAGRQPCHASTQSSLDSGSRAYTWKCCTAWMKSWVHRGWPGSERGLRLRSRVSLGFLGLA